MGIVAGHLPRGTGPQGEDLVGQFSSTEVRSCRLKYKTQVNESVHNIERAVRDLQEQRKVVSKCKQEFCEVFDNSGSKELQRLKHKAAHSNASNLVDGTRFSVMDDFRRPTQLPKPYVAQESSPPDQSPLADEGRKASRRGSAEVSRRTSALAE